MTLPQCGLECLSLASNNISSMRPNTTTPDHPNPNTNNNILGSLFASLKENQSLTLLDLSHNLLNFYNFDNELLEDFSKNNHLLYLMLSYNQLIYNEKSSESFTAFLNLLPVSLSHLNLSGTGIDDTNIGHIYTASLNKSNLKHLNISENTLGRDSGHTLSLLLKNNSYLMDLDLTDIRLGDTGARLIAESIGENKTLRKLKLSRNRIGPAALEIVTSSTHNSSLKILDLRSNTISNDILKQINKLILNSPLNVHLSTY